MVNRSVLAHRLFTGIFRRHLARLIEELAVPWQAGPEGRRHAARGGTRKRPGALPGRIEQWERDRHDHSSDRITVQHALADHKRWRQLTRWTHRRDRPPDTYHTITNPGSDRTAQA
ncbi:hypothetical protein [Streptomyces sp. NPDC014623]|uniref:hypothetical protein n=1 Tax=Streptomyces sp. NPDC014623 TaxID=3364875 RepID=UPI0036FE61F4